MIELLDENDVSLACLHLEDYIDYLSANEEIAIETGKSVSFRANISLAISAKEKLEMLSRNLQAKECEQIIFVLRQARSFLEESFDSITDADRPDALHHLAQLNRTIRKFRKILEASPPPHI